MWEDKGEREKQKIDSDLTTLLIAIIVRWVFFNFLLSFLLLMHEFLIISFFKKDIVAADFRVSCVRFSEAGF